MNAQKIDKMSGHWVLAKAGKKVLRPGGKKLTEKMLSSVSISSKYKVVEFAPGLGFTAKKILSQEPQTYIGIDSDNNVIGFLTNKFKDTRALFLARNAAQTELEDGSVTRVVGEAILTTHADHRKREIIREAYRILKPDGIYAIHELGLQPIVLPETRKNDIQKDLAMAIKVNARPLTISEWKYLLEQEGFTVINQAVCPMRLLEIKRMISDETFSGFLRIIGNILLHPLIRKRILQMRSIFRKHEENLCAVMLIAKKNE